MSNHGSSEVTQLVLRPNKDCTCLKTHLNGDQQWRMSKMSRLKTLKKKLEKARAANAIYESEKVKERLEREAETAKKFALEKFAKNLLETVDNLERALQATGEEQTPLSEGVELTLKGLLTTLEKAGVVVVDTANGFNADLHQAVGIDPNAKSGEIGTVLQKGYTLSGRLLRPAMVMVGQ